MIPSAPPEFWARVIERLAQLIFERENMREGFKTSDPPHLRPVPADKPDRPAS